MRHRIKRAYRLLGNRHLQRDSRADKRGGFRL
jgi:hypothetical protein